MHHQFRSGDYVRYERNDKIYNDSFGTILEVKDGKASVVWSEGEVKNWVMGRYGHSIHIVALSNLRLVYSEVKYEPGQNGDTEEDI